MPREADPEKYELGRQLLRDGASWSTVKARTGLCNAAISKLQKEMNVSRDRFMEMAGRPQELTPEHEEPREEKSAPAKEIPPAAEAGDRARADMGVRPYCEDGEGGTEAGIDFRAVEFKSMPGMPEAQAVPVELPPKEPPTLTPADACQALRRAADLAAAACQAKTSSPWNSHRCDEAPDGKTIRLCGKTPVLDMRSALGNEGLPINYCPWCGEKLA